ncbi:MAG: hypothetical protein PUE30_05880 [Spirochaetia bacterium]|nr:hypothetical protein [Spirochaetia bacterium]
MKKLSRFAAILAGTALLFFGAGCSSDDDGGGSSSDPVIDTNPDKTVTITIDDDQKGYVSGTGSLGKGKTGWNATNDSFWENFGSNGDANIKYCVNTDTAGEYKMILRYCFGGWCDTLKDVTVSINGKTVETENDGNIFYIDYTSNKNWANKEISVNLDKGDNFIVIKCAYGTQREFTVPVKLFSSEFSAANPNADVGSKCIGTVNSMPNIDWISITSTVPGVKMSAGSSNATAYWDVSITSENTNFGTVTLSPAQNSYTNGTEIILTATPAAGYKFDCWHGDVSSNNAEFKVLVTKDLNVKARFIPETYANEDLEGYASVCDDAGTAYTITGGFGGEEITIASYADLLTYKSKISGNDPAIINVTARISSAEWIDTAEYNKELETLTASKGAAEAKFILKNRSFTFDIGSNKTILGEAGQDYGFKNINPKISGTNVIVKYLHFGDVIGDDYFGGKGNDALSIKGGQHVWIDHCEFSSSLTPKEVDGVAINFDSHDFIVDLEGENSTLEEKWTKDFYDGLLDVSETSRFVSVSNSYFHDHWKACLCGGSNDKAESQPQGSQVRMTMYNNYFENIHSRQPLFRFGRAHIYSSYLKGAGSDATGIEVRAESLVYVDNVCFENIRSDRKVGCWNSSSGLGEGKWTVKDCPGESDTNNAGFTPPYEWTKTSASDSKTNLPTKAGIK